MTTSFSGGTSAQLGADLAQLDSAEAVHLVHHLETQVNRLFLITEALWQLLREQHGYSETELADRIKQLDLGDGILDGSVHRQEILTCPNCHRVHANRNQVTCLYCGAEVLKNVFEKT
jgi:hypothetical protein